MKNLILAATILLPTLAFAHEHEAAVQYCLRHTSANILPSECERVTKGFIYCMESTPLSEGQCLHAGSDFEQCYLAQPLEQCLTN